MRGSFTCIRGTAVPLYEATLFVKKFLSHEERWPFGKRINAFIVAAASFGHIREAGLC